MAFKLENSSAALPEKLVAAVRQYIEENYTPDEDIDEYSGMVGFAPMQHQHSMDEPMACRSICAGSAAAGIPEQDSLEEFLQELDAGFSETLLRLIDRSGKKDSEVYKKAHIDRKLFSKIRSQKNYQPSKPTALAFAFALELTLDETEDFIARAGFALSHSSRFDLIVEYFLIHRSYDITELNQVLYQFDQPLIGA